MPEAGSPLWTAATVAGVVGAGLTAGVFFAFSTFVTSGLRRLPPAQGLAAMQSINVTAVTPAFMTLLAGTAGLSAVLLVRGALRLGDASGRLLVAAALLYLLGAIAVTGVRNVPMNDALALLDPAAPGSAAAWSGYLDRWVTWNHVRTAACALSALAFALAARA